MVVARHPGECWLHVCACGEISRGCELGVVVLRCDEVGGDTGSAGESWRCSDAPTIHTTLEDLDHYVSSLMDRHES